MTKQRCSFSPEFKRNAAELTLDQSYGRLDACGSVGVAEARAPKGHKSALLRTASTPGFGLILPNLIGRINRARRCLPPAAAPARC